MSELYGRVRVIQVSNLVFLVFNLACGFATNTGQMLAFRFIAGVGGAAPLGKSRAQPGSRPRQTPSLANDGSFVTPSGIGSGVLSDLWRAEERGTANAWYSLGPLLGPAIGPILVSRGGRLAGRWG